MREFEIKPELHKTIEKIFKKDKGLYNALVSKMNQILNAENIEHYKNLRSNMKESKRVHIGHFVLIFSYNKREDIIIFEYFDHHDNVYMEKK